MQHSFGAQYLYVPHRYRRGQGSDEPCDLLWYGNGTLVLFYATAGNKSYEKQDSHNLSQARRWGRYWTSHPDTPLVGENRFADRIELRRHQIQNWIAISIVSSNVGVVFHPYSKGNIPGFVCTIPESMIHAIAANSGTVVDLLELLHGYSKNLLRHISRNSSASHDRLHSLLKRHFIAPAKPEIVKNVDPAFQDKNSDVVFNLIARYRMAGKFESIAVDRPSLAEFFCDLSAKDYFTISQCALAAIHRTQDGKLSVVLVTDGLFLDWIIFATSAYASNSAEIYSNMLKSTGSLGKGELPTIIYAYDGEGQEYRSPSMFTFPEHKKPGQAMHFMERIMKRLHSDPIRGTPS